MNHTGGVYKYCVYLYIYIRPGCILHIYIIYYILYLLHNGVKQDYKGLYKYFLKNKDKCFTSYIIKCITKSAFPINVKRISICTNFYICFQSIIITSFYMCVYRSRSITNFMILIIARAYFYLSSEN